MSLLKTLQEQNNEQTNVQFVIVKCDWCGTIQKRQYRKLYATRSHHFCSKYCCAKFKHKTHEKDKYNLYFCPFCDEVVFRFQSLFAKHLKNKHNQDIINCTYKAQELEFDPSKNINELYVEHVLGGEWPLCKCGCGTKLPNPRLKQRYILGHIFQGGDANFCWNGGISPVAQLARSHGLLHKKWRLPILERDNYMCQICGTTDRNILQVHHYEQTFDEILSLIINQVAPDIKDLNDLPQDQKRKIAKLVAEYHIENNVKGVTLCEGHHYEVGFEPLSVDFPKTEDNNKCL